MPAIVDPWKEAHDALSAYVTALMENRDQSVKDQAFNTYTEAHRAASDSGSQGDQP